MDAGFPVLALAPSGRAAADIEALLRRLRDELGADIVVVWDRDDLLALAPAGPSAAWPPACPSTLAPMASMSPGQLYAMHAGGARGLRTLMSGLRAHREGDPHELTFPRSRPVRRPGPELRARGDHKSTGKDSSTRSVGV